MYMYTVCTGEMVYVHVGDKKNQKVAATHLFV